MSRWYNLLNSSEDSLINNYQTAILSRSVIISKETNYGRKYRLFDTYIDLARFLKNDNNPQHYHEIILSGSSQKFRVDIDIEEEYMCLGESVKNDVISSIMKVLENNNIEATIENNICVCSSNGANKASYHIILDKYCNTDEISCYMFYVKMMEHINPDFRMFIDRGVYKPNQSFRLVGSSKMNSTRIKQFDNIFSYNGDQYKFRYIREPREYQVYQYNIMTSLISLTVYCTILPCFGERPQREIQIIDDTLVLVYIEMLEKIFPDWEDLFSFKGLKGNRIDFINISGYDCKSCCRFHENENPCMKVSNGALYFSCRRGDSIYLGNIPENINEDDNNNIITCETIKQTNYKDIFSMYSQSRQDMTRLSSLY